MGVGSIPVSILPSWQYMKNIALYLHRYEYTCSRVVKIRNTSEAVLRYTPFTGLGQYDGSWEYCDPNTAPSVFLILISHQSK